MEPNEMVIRRVFVRPVDQLAPDDTLVGADDNQIVVEWEAGATVNADVTADIQVHISVWNHKTGVQAAIYQPPPVGPNGNNQSCIYELVQLVSGATDFVAGNFYEITTCLYRKTKTAAFYKGPLFAVR